MKPILEVKNLTIKFEEGSRKELTAVNNVSFCLYPNETLGIVGESGSGKSTIARAVTRLINVSQGQIILEGRDITRVKGRSLRDIYRQMQMVFQSPAASFDPRQTLGEGIGESLKNRGIGRKQREETVGKLLASCGLSEGFSRRYPHEVSGGQCQRAAIARALAADPRILICDEVTSALDVTAQAQVMELLNHLKERHRMSCLFISHDLALVQQFCDRVLVLKNGSVVEEGTPDQVILSPREEYTRQLVDAVLQ